jgi:hypothetical protein
MIITVTSARQKEDDLVQPLIVYAIPSLGCPARPVAPGWQVSPAHRPSPREAASTTGSGGVSGEPSCWGVDHLRGDDGSCSW